MLFGLLDLKHVDARHDLADGLGREEKLRAAGIQRPQRKMQFIAGRLLARQLLRQRYGDAPWTLTAIPATPVRIVGHPGLQLSISHSGRWVACVLADFPVGVDIELIKPGRPVAQMAELVCSTAERHALAALGDGYECIHHFYRLWTMKEAWLKQHASPLSLELMRSLDAVPSPAKQANLFSLIDPHRKLAIALATPPGKITSTSVCQPAVPALPVDPHYLLSRMPLPQGAPQRAVQ